MVESKYSRDALVWMSGDYVARDLQLVNAVVREGLSKLTETTVVFLSKTKSVKLEDFVGRNMRVHIKTAEEAERVFTGLCVSVENLGYRAGHWLFEAEVRPWFWLLTRRQNCRIFQEKTAVEIIQEIFSENGFSDFKNSLNDSYDTRNYCVQYRESDYAFVCRLMEEEGIYFYFRNDLDSTKVEELILCDSISAHQAVPETPSLEFHARQARDLGRQDHISEWAPQEILTRGRMTLNEYDFLNPTNDMETTSAIRKGKHSYNEFEVYDYPGHYRTRPELESRQARVRMEAEAVRHQKWRGACNVRTMGTGRTFTLKEHPDKSNNKDYLVTEAVHYIQEPHMLDSKDARDAKGGPPQKGDKGGKAGEKRFDLKIRNLDIPEEMQADSYACVLGAIPKQEQFRAPLVTPWPEIPGLHTAIVVGKPGEEIWTDEHGRIKVQFHWDRDGKSDEKSSCWVRVVTPWSGKGWGMIAVPRMGQEVVIQFEEGDPDRPICTGMLYHQDNKPPYPLPDEMTKTGIKTDSSKDVSDAQAYNELVFDDKAGQELMRVQAQKDHEMLVKNRSVVTIGRDEPVEQQSEDDEHSLTQTVRKNVTETIQEGDHTFTIETGSQTIEIKSDKTETILDGDNFFTIETGSQTIDIKTDKTQTIKGKHTKTITGNDETTVKAGNMVVDVSSGKITMSAAIEIMLKVGGSSIKIDNSGVTIKGPLIKIQADAMAEMKSPMTTVKGDVMLTLKGGVTMIN